MKTIVKLLRENLRSSFVSLVLLLGIMLFVFIVVMVLLTLAGERELLRQLPFSELIYGISLYFLLIYGIVMPLMTQSVLSFGATRLQYAISTAANGLIISLAVCATGVAAAIIEGNFDLLMAVFYLLTSFGAYLLGWYVVLGFMHRRFITAASSLLTAILIVALALSPLVLATLYDPALLDADNFATAYPRAVMLQSSLISAGLIVVGTPIICLIHRRVPIKAS